MTIYIMSEVLRLGAAEHDNYSATLRRQSDCILMDLTSSAWPDSMAPRWQWRVLWCVEVDGGMFGIRSRHDTDRTLLWLMTQGEEFIRSVTAAQSIDLLRDIQW